MALESILGYGIRSSISHRMAIRGSKLLADDIATRMDYYQVLKYFYDQRSKLVHNEQIELELPDKSNIKKHFENIGYKEEQFKMYSEHNLIEILRQITHEILWKFIRADINLDKGELLDLELM